MDYAKLYNSLISNAVKRKLVEGYCEVHHIVPKSMGGSDDKSNLVKLTAREHFIAHYLLAKIHGGTQWISISRFKYGRKESYFNSRLYEIAKIQIAKTLSERYKGKPMHEDTKVKISIKNKGREVTLETRAKIGAANKVSLKGRKISPEAIAKRIATTKGRTRPPFSEEWRNNLSIANTGKKHSKERKLKTGAALSLALLAKKQSILKQFAFGQIG